jgi:DNA-binding MarR family transcriptional regulator
MIAVGKSWPDNQPQMSSGVNHRFEVDGKGRIHETSVSESMTRLQEMFPDIDRSALETQIMLERSHRLLANGRDAQWSEFGLTGSRYILLRLLYVSPSKRLTMGEIAANMNLGQNGVTQLVDAMADAGLVERKPGDEDRRVINANLTDKGAALFELVLPLTAKRIERAWAPLSQNERELLSHLLAKLRMHLLANEALLEDDHPSDQGQLKPSRRRQLGRP